MSLHQGGIVSTPAGEWWGFSMMDYNSVGRLLGLSPITWKGGWPYFGLPGNLERSPRTWIKPNTGHTSAPRAPYERSDDFSGKTLKPVWQWNHVPVDGQWSLTERPGFLRLHAQPAKSFWFARNTVTQRSVGPMSTPTATLDLSGLTFSGITFTFTNGTTLGPGQFFVLARDGAAFASKYPGVNVRGTYTGQLDNAGEQIALTHPLGTPVFSVTYDDRPDWPVGPDVADFSLVQTMPGLSQAPDKGNRWRASTTWAGANPTSRCGTSTPGATAA